MSFKFIVQACAHFLCCVFFASASYAQGLPAPNAGGSNEKPYISWVSQYPASKAAETKHNAAVRIYEFLIKKNKESGLSRPVGVVAANPADRKTAV